MANTPAARRKSLTSRERIEAQIASMEAETTFGWLVYDLHRLLRRGFEKRAKAMPLTRAQWRALMVIHRNDGMTQSELADDLDMERAPLGRLIDRLEGAGWVERRPDPKDRRANRLHVTAKLEPVIPIALAALSALFSKAVEGVSPAEFQAIMSGLERLKQNLIKADGELAGRHNRP